MPGLTVRPYQADDAGAWKAHLSNSNNGTLYHDLDFLAYHPAGKFDFHHFIVLDDNEIVAIVPGALRSDRIYISPAGASIGGPVVGKKLGTEGALGLIAVMQEYARGQGWRGIEFTLAPPVYLDEPNQLIEFALHLKGFKLVQRAMPLLLPVRSSGTKQYQQLFKQSRRSYVRANQRKGVIVRDAGGEAFGAFRELFDDTYNRLGSTPTHTPTEIEDLLRRIPDRVRLWLAWLDDIAIAGVLLFVLNRNISYIFYICDRASHREYHGSTVLFADLIDALAARGFRYLDLGPSASSDHFNSGVIYFKESLGAQAFCRDRWRWDDSV